MAATTEWNKLLADALVPDPVVSGLKSLGYDSKASFNFESEEVFKAFGKHALVTKKLVAGVSESDWTFHPMLGKLRQVWQACRPAQVAPAVTALALPQPGQPGVLAALGASSSPAKLTVAHRDKMRRDLEAKYTGLYVTEASLPSVSLLQLVQNQCTQKAWEWLPWKKLLSEKAALELHSRRPRSAKEDAFEQLLLNAGGGFDEEWDMDLSPSPFRLQQMLTVRGHAYAMSCRQKSVLY